MKPLIFLFGLSACFNAFAHDVTQFSASKDYAEVCNNTTHDIASKDPYWTYLGRTKMKVLYWANGCAGLHEKQPLVCSAQIVEAGHCARYHFRWGTSSRNAMLCVHLTSDKPNRWHCGSEKIEGHYSFPIDNQQRAMVNNLKFMDRSDGEKIEATGSLVPF